MSTRRLLRAIAGAATLTLLLVAPVLGHVIEKAGTYTLALGWQHEPTYVGEQNAVQVIVTDAAGKPVNDLGPDDLKVVVSTAGQQTGELTFDPGYDADTGLGTPGEYDAAIMPTAPGDYTFHLTGTIHGTKVDFTETSSETTFDAVKGTSDIEFPAKLPTTAEIVTRLDRIDARLQALPQSGSTQSDVSAANTAASDARQAAQQALILGGGAGVAGIFIGAVGIYLALRTSRRPA